MSFTRVALLVWLLGLTQKEQSSGTKDKRSEGIYRRDFKRNIFEDVWGDESKF
jgi:hypothetical protein